MLDGVTIVVTMDVKPDAVEALSANLAAMLKDTATRPGFRNIRIVRAGNKLSLIQQWDSEADYDAYFAWRTERGDVDGLASIVNGVEKSVWPTLVATA